MNLLESGEQRYINAINNDNNSSLPLLWFLMSWSLNPTSFSNGKVTRENLTDWKHIISHKWKTSTQLLALTWFTFKAHVRPVKLMRLSFHFLISLLIILLFFTVDFDVLWNALPLPCLLVIFWLWLNSHRFLSRAKRGTFTDFIKGKPWNFYTLYLGQSVELLHTLSRAKPWTCTHFILWLWLNFHRFLSRAKGGTFTDFIKGKAWNFYTLYLGQSVELVHTLSWAKRWTFTHFIKGKAWNFNNFIQGKL